MLSNSRKKEGPPNGWGLLLVNCFTPDVPVVSTARASSLKSPVWRGVVLVALVVGLMATHFSYADEQNKPPVAVMDVSPNSGSVPLTVDLDATESYDSDGNIASYTWISGDGQKVTGVQAQMTFSAKGIFAIDLIVVDNNGAVAEKIALVSVGKIGCAGQTAYNLETGTVYLPFVDLAIAPSIVDVTKPVIVIDTLEGDLKLNFANGLIDITRIGNVVSEDKNSSCHANYVQDTRILTIPRIDVPVISPMNGTPTLLGTDVLVLGVFETFFS
ncbi:MAG TPA: PKD domain-containing protein [Thioploca sp.]|nr:PKD domain-containing protein [Thioploca sp.]